MTHKTFNARLDEMLEMIERALAAIEQGGGQPELRSLQKLLQELLINCMRLLERNPSLDASIRLRLPYIEPLNLLQIELLKRHRAGESDPRIREGIQLSINAIATALRNSG